jgi:hypothetical protein
VKKNLEDLAAEQSKVPGAKIEARIEVRTS